MLWFLKKIPPDKIFPRSYMDFEQKYQKDPGSYRVNERTDELGNGLSLNPLLPRLFHVKVFLKDQAVSSSWNLF